MIDLSLYEVDLDTQRPNPFDNTKVLRGDSPRTAFTKHNDMLLALHAVIQHVGALSPSPTTAYMLWLDTSTNPPTERQRNPENTAWVIKTSRLGLTLMGELASVDDLPEDAANGDTYIIDGHAWAWSGSAWVDTGQIVGPEGPIGPEGPVGPSLAILGEVATELELPEDASIGDGYLVGGDLLVWNGVLWFNAGPIRGEAGPAGQSFNVDEYGLFSERALFDDEPEPFSYLATDTGMLYLRMGDAGVWSDGIEFGRGEKGDTGPGVPVAGTAGQVLVKATGADFSTSWVTLDKESLGLANVDNTADIDKPISSATAAALALKANIESPVFTGTVGGITKVMVGLGNVDNTADAGKPVSTAQQAAFDLKANLESPTLTGTPLVPTAVVGTNTTQAASTAFVRAEVASLVSASPEALDTLAELAAALGNDPDFATTVTNEIATKEPANANIQGHIASTDNPHGVTKAQVGLGNVDNTSDSNKPVSTAQAAALNLKAPLESPTFTGTVGGISKAMVGLGAADNTSDEDKPISTAQAAGLVSRTGATGAARIPAGTTVQRPADPVYGDQRANNTLNSMEWYNGTAWVPMGGGATGAPGNPVFFQNAKVVTGDYTIPGTDNAGTFGPLQIADGVTVTISNGATWTIV